MRKALVMAGFLLVALAGCSGQPAPADDDGTADDDGRTSKGRTSQGGNTTDPPHDDVILIDAPVDLVGQATQTFDVQVPVNVTIVDFRIDSPGPTTQFGALRVELEGCGVYDMGTSFQGSTGGSASETGRLCEDASEGKHTLTVSNTGLVQGSIKLTGQVPKANETASAPAS